MDLDTATCLDIGTGTGILLLVAAHLGIKNLVGIDYRKSMLQIKLELTVRIIMYLLKSFVVIWIVISIVLPN